MSIKGYTSHVSTKKTPQSEPVLGKNQIENAAGGFVFEVDKWTQLDRFLILGSDQPTYYASAKSLTTKNANIVHECLNDDPGRVIDTIVDISTKGRAPKNEPAIFALAMAAAHKDEPTRTAALAALPQVCRIGTHLFAFCEAVQEFRGWGRALKRAVANWYLEKDAGKVAYQVTKYQQRDGWSHRDVLRLSKPVTKSDRYSEHNAIFGWVTGQKFSSAHLPDSITGFEVAKRATSAKEIVGAIEQFGLVRECIPTQFQKFPEVWEALLKKMPLTAMIRNLPTMTRTGLIAPMSDAVSTVVDRLTDHEYLRKSRIHPIQVLLALKTYQGGRSIRGSNTWTPVSQVVDALDEAFYQSFPNVVSTGKRFMLALDVSGSMGGFYGSQELLLTPREVAAAMAMTTARTERNHVVMAFSNRFIELEVSPRERLDDIVRKTSRLPFMGTDCSLPMIYAQEKNIFVDVFVVITDNETWAGRIHPFQALQQYRANMGIGAKLAVLGITATECSIADPSDAGMIDFAGFDANVPILLSDFAKN